jgi:hypothetical protein
MAAPWIALAAAATVTERSHRATNGKTRTNACGS